MQLARLCLIWTIHQYNGQSNSLSYSQLFGNSLITGVIFLAINAVEFVVSVLWCASLPSVQASCRKWSNSLNICIFITLRLKPFRKNAYIHFLDTWHRTQRTIFVGMAWPLITLYKRLIMIEVFALPTGTWWTSFDVHCLQTTWTNSEKPKESCIFLQTNPIIRVIFFYYNYNVPDRPFISFEKSNLKVKVIVYLLATAIHKRENEAFQWNT